MPVPAVCDPLDDDLTDDRGQQRVRNCSANSPLAKHPAVCPTAFTELGQRMAGRAIALPDLRSQFARVFQTQLPPYQARRGW